MRTPISYYGGKQAMLHHILPMIPEHDCYTEVFFGGGSVFWAKHPARNETINDKLDIVINLYRVLKNDFKNLKSLIDETILSRTMHRESLSIIRKKETHSPLKLAWAFWMATNFSFSNKIGGDKI